MEPKWFYYFNNKDKDSLLHYYKKIEGENILICQELKTRRYAIFKNFAAFGKYFTDTSEDERCFYEMIRPEDNRKPYFDIDVEGSFDFNIKNMVKTIREILGDKIKILVFTSHISSKKSFHIVVDDVCFKNYKELEIFYEKVIEKLEEEEKKFVDKSVYKSVQQFRLVGSHKYGKQNTKVLDEILSYNYKLPDRNKTNIQGEFNYKLSISLVSNTESCEFISGFENIIKQEKNIGRGASCEGDVEDVMRIFYSTYSPDDFSFSGCKETNGNLLIILRRLNPTFCKNCNRMHEGENPFLVTSSEFRNIYFYCRRGDKEKINSIYLGSLGIPVLANISIDEVVNIEELYSNTLESKLSDMEPSFLDTETKLEELALKRNQTPIIKKSRKSILNSVHIGNLVH